MKTVIIFMLWFIITWSFVEFFPLVSLSSRGIYLNFLFFLSLSYLPLKFTFWIWWRFRACFPIIRLSTFPKPLPFSFGSGETFSTILLVRFSNLDIRVSAKSWKLLFRHVCISGCSSYFGLGQAFSFTKCVGGRGCNTSRSPEWVSLTASAMFKRNNNNSYEE